ncbi:MAG: D-alanyl-D-alanine carboxypeptidase family protein [Actinomycetota bacterium]
MAAVLLVLFGVSCLITASQAHVWPLFERNTTTVNGPAGQKASPPGTWASAAVLADAESGHVLYEKNAHVKLPMASVTKMLTALVVRDKMKLEDTVTASPEAVAVGEMEVGLVAGQSYTVDSLLWSLMVASANDSAYALALHIGGSIPGFAELMNQKARAIGAVESNFTNPHGLDEPNHYSTAYDLAVIGRQLLADPVLAQMVSCSRHEISWPGSPTPVLVVGHNEFLAAYPGANGIKTGYTLDAGMCLAASATRDGKSLVAVVLNSQHRAEDASAMFDYGFSQAERIVLVKGDAELGRCRVNAFPRRYTDVRPDRELAVLSLKGSGDVFGVTTVVQREAKAPVKKGQKLGDIDCTLNGNPLYRQSALATRSVDGETPPGVLAAFLWYSLCWLGRILSAPFRIF